jgi:hypothetical protein
MKTIYIEYHKGTPSYHSNYPTESGSMSLKKIVEEIFNLPNQQSSQLFKTLNAENKQRGGAMMLKNHASNTSAKTLKINKIGKKQTQKKH